MQFLIAGLIALSMTLPAAAQQQMQIPPAQIALGINQAVGGMAMELEGAHRQIAHLQAENEKQRKDNEALKAKCGEPCKGN